MPTAFAPGRVNLIGDHTDYTGGFAVPMAIHLGTTVAVRRGGPELRLHSEHDASVARLVLPIDGEREAVSPSGNPGWARYVAAVAAELDLHRGGTGTVSTTLPVGAGLSSSASLEIAVALALGFEGSALELARLGRRAEHRAVGVPCGLMDHLASAAGVEGHALLLDCTEERAVPVPLPPDAEITAVHSGETRQLVASAYAERRAECHAAAETVGPLRSARPEDLAAISDPTIRRRARHVVTENARALAFAEALRGGDLRTAGSLMGESHRSLREDFEVSTPALDALVAGLAATEGVYGARLTGAGFGGCAVTLGRPGALGVGWRLRAAGPAVVQG